MGDCTSEKREWQKKFSCFCYIYSGWLQGKNRGEIVILYIDL